MNENVSEALQDVETLIMKQHYNSARQKLVRMQNLYPCAVDHIGSMLTLCEVLSAAKLTVGGLGVDHYWVLNASPFHKPCHIKAHYDQILSSLHPLKKTFPAAESGVEAVETAFSVISDRQRRSRFDSDRNAAWESLSLSKPCQDFFDFESGREWFEEGQIWAATSLEHGYMYGRVSFKGPLHRVTWLSPIPVSPSERRWCEAGLPVSCGTFQLCPDQTASDLSWSYNCDWVRGALEGQFEIYPRRGQVWAIFKDWDIHDWAYRGLDTVKRSKLELVEITSEFSKYTGVDCSYLAKVNGFGYVFERKTTREALHVAPSMLYMFCHRVPAYRFTGGEIDRVAEGMLELDRAALPDCRIDNADNEIEIQSLSVVEQCRRAKDFSEGQIWAVRCGNDFMPRQYARVDRIDSDFQLRVTFLEPLITLHTEEAEWKKENLPIVSGVFKLGTTTHSVQVSQFSYVVKCRQRNDPFYEIHPMKGEIWAVYKNWNNKWKQCDHQAYECQVVQILSDMSERDGTKIARLQLVKGCLTFFQKQQCDGFDLTCLVSNSEALSFSHRIPAFRVPGIRRYGIPESSWHLDPNALPPNRRVQY